MNEKKDLLKKCLADIMKENTKNACYEKHGNIRVLFVNFDSNHAVLGGRYVFYKLANAYYEKYGNAVLYTITGKSLAVTKADLKIPLKIIKTKSKKQIFRVLEFNLKLLFLKEKFDVCITNQHIFGSHLKSILHRKKHLYVMHDNLPLTHYSKFSDKLYMLIVKFFFKIGFFVSVSRTNFRKNSRLLGVVYNGL